MTTLSNKEMLKVALSTMDAKSLKELLEVSPTLAQESIPIGDLPYIAQAQLQVDGDALLTTIPLNAALISMGLGYLASAPFEFTQDKFDPLKVALYAQDTAAVTMLVSESDYTAQHGLEALADYFAHLREDVSIREQFMPTYLLNYAPMVLRTFSHVQAASYAICSKALEISQTLSDPHQQQQLTSILDISSAINVRINRANLRDTSKNKVSMADYVAEAAHVRNAISDTTLQILGQLQQVGVRLDAVAFEQTLASTLNNLAASEVKEVAVVDVLNTVAKALPILAGMSQDVDLDALPDFLTNKINQIGRSGNIYLSEYSLKTEGSRCAPAVMNLQQVALAVKSQIVEQEYLQKFGQPEKPQEREQVGYSNHTEMQRI